MKYIPWLVISILMIITGMFIFLIIRLVDVHSDCKKISETINEWELIYEENNTKE